MARVNRTFAVIGLGAFGTTVAQELARSGSHVMGIDMDEARVTRVASSLASTAILDTTDENALRDVGIGQFDVALVAIGRDIQASILTTMNLRMLGVETIWVKASNRTHHRILSKLGADRVILPEQEMGRHVAQMLRNAALQDYVSLGNGYSVVNITAPEKMDGKGIEALELGSKHDLRLLGVMRGSEFLEAGSDLLLATDDRLILLGKKGDLQGFGDAL
ncbi:MAG: TrkA family potassium uptake protein [Pseudooceanicola sp.]|nr:TrkA family potassium uptake protein [Pseudooceanicola sp.]